MKWGAGTYVILDMATIAHQELVNRVVFQFSINKDHARERIDHLMEKNVINIDYQPNRFTDVRLWHFFKNGDEGFVLRMYK